MICMKINTLQSFRDRQQETLRSLLFVCLCYLGHSFPLLLIHAEVLQAETCFKALRANPAGLVVQGLWTLCADGLQKTELLPVKLLKIKPRLAPRPLPAFPSFPMKWSGRCSPLRRTCSDVCAWWSWNSRCSLCMFASPCPFSWSFSGKRKYTSLKYASLTQA